MILEIHVDLIEKSLMILLKNKYVISLDTIV